MLGAAYEELATTALDARQPVAQPKPKPSVWGSVYRTVNAVPRGIATAAAEVAGSVAETVGGFGQVLGAYPEAFGYSPTGEARQQADTARAKLMRDGVDMNNDIGDSLREAGRSYRPDPATSNVAEQLLYTFARGASKVVAGAVVGGPVGIGAAALEEANTQSDELRAQGVQFGPRVAAGAVQGAGLALAALPLVGNTMAQTAGLYVLGGPGGFMAQQALTREILQNAGQDKIAAQFDPFDPVGLAVSMLIPAAFTAYGLRGQRLQRAADSLPPDLATAEGRAPVVEPVTTVADPFPGVLTPTAAAARYYPPEVVDAAMVTHLAEQRRASNPGDVTIRAADQHEAALTRAEDQIARGEPVQVADVAPASTAARPFPALPALADGDSATLTLKSGEPVTVVRKESPGTAGTGSTLEVTNDRGDVVATLDFFNPPEGAVQYNGSPLNVDVAPAYRRQGLGTQLYDLVENAGVKLAKPAGTTSDDALALRSYRDGRRPADPIEQFANNLRTGLDAMRRELDAAAPVNQGGALRSVAPETKPPEAAAPTLTDAATTQATRAEAATPAGVAGADTSGVPGARAGAVEAGGLTPAEVTARFDAQVKGDMDAAIRAYEQLPDTKGGKIVNTDEARALSPDYNASNDTRSLFAPAVHDTSSAIAKEQYKRLLAKPAVTGDVLILAGGGGSGKTSSLESVLPGYEAKFDAIYDTTLSKLDTAVKNIEDALSSGRGVTVAFTARDPFESIANGIIPRAGRTGRTVPLDVAIKAHQDVRTVLPSLMERYADDDRVQFRIVDNTRGPGQARMVDIGELPNFDYNGLAGRAFEAARSAYETGQISEAAFRGLVGQGESQVGAGLRSGEGRSSDAGTGGRTEQVGARQAEAASRTEQGLTQPNGALRPEQAAISARLDAITQRFPDMTVMLDGMDTPMRMSDFLAAAKKEADEAVADAPDLMDAASCFLLNGA